MKHIQTLNTRDMAKSAQNGGCGECQTSCQSACKTSWKASNLHETYGKRSAGWAGVREHSGHCCVRPARLTIYKIERKGRSYDPSI